MIFLIHSSLLENKFFCLPPIHIFAKHNLINLKFSTKTKKPSINFLKNFL